MKNEVSALAREREITEEPPMDQQDKYFVLACLVIGLIGLLIGSWTGEP